MHFVFSFFAALLSPVLAVVLGVGKEFLDVLEGDGADPLDLLADGLGILFAGWVD